MLKQEQLPCRLRAVQKILRLYVVTVTVQQPVCQIHFQGPHVEANSAPRTLLLYHTCAWRQPMQLLPRHDSNHIQRNKHRI
jgi:hypothetical protein